MAAFTVYTGQQQKRYGALFETAILRRTDVLMQ
jgi:hypothetical protein